MSGETDGVFSLCPHAVGGEGASWGLGSKETNPIMGAPPT